MNNPQNNPNQIHPELMSLSCLNPWDGANSSGRKYMFAGHLGQTLSIAAPTERRVQTGMEREYGKYTFNIKMPENGRVVKVLKLYPTTMGYDNIPHSPLTLMIYENENGEYGCVEITDYHYHYHYYGFAYKPMAGMSKLREGEYIAEGTVFMDSNAVKEDGAYCYGRNTNVAFMSIPEVAEDAIVISESALEAFGYRTYEKRSVSYGKDKFPINLYGDENIYKPFPDIGEYLHPKGQHAGMLMALREYDEELAGIEQSAVACNYPDITFDECVYAAGRGGRVVDIRIYHDVNNSCGGTDAVMAEQPLKYDKARRRFYSELVQFYREKAKTHKEHFKLTPELHRWILEAIAIIGEFRTHKVNDKIEMLYRKKPLDEWRIEFTIEYCHIPGIGGKLTGSQGNKGVICTVRPDHLMPYDANGVRAEMIIDGNATFSRMNLGNKYEPFINSASRDLVVELKRRLQVQGNEHNLFTILQQTDRAIFDEAWNRLMRYYQILSPRQYRMMTEEYTAPREQHMEYVLKNGIYIYLPTDNEPEYMSYVEAIQKEFPPTYGPVYFQDKQGNIHQTKTNVRIAEMYIMLLEKTGKDWSAVSSGRVQQHGILAPLSAMDKNNTPAKQQPTRSLGEAEIRNFASYLSPVVAAELIDRNNNPEVHKEIVRNILAAPQPTNIEEVVDRKRFPLGYCKPLQIAKHLAYCSGYSFRYKPVDTLTKPE